MKQFFLLTAFFGLFAFANAQAQNCLYPKSAESRVAAAAKAASTDASIEQRIDKETGAATYVRKNVCDATGKVSYTEVEYCSKSGKFVNVSPREQHCVKSKAGCTAKGARAAKVSTTEKIHCTAAQKAACAKAKSPTSASAAKLVKNR